MKFAITRTDFSLPILVHVIIYLGAMMMVER